MTVTVSPKYQVVIPKEVRRAIALQPGTKVAVIAKGGVAYIVPIPTRRRVLGLVTTALGRGGLRDKKDRL